MNLHAFIKAESRCTYIYKESFCQFTQSWTYRGLWMICLFFHVWSVRSVWSFSIFYQLLNPAHRINYIVILSQTFSLQVNKIVTVKTKCQPQIQFNLSLTWKWLYTPTTTRKMFFFFKNVLFFKKGQNFARKRLVQSSVPLWRHFATGGGSFC